MGRIQSESKHFTIADVILSCVRRRVTANYRKNSRDYKTLFYKLWLACALPLVLDNNFYILCTHFLPWLHLWGAI